MTKAGNFYYFLKIMDYVIMGSQADKLIVIYKAYEPPLNYNSGALLTC